MLVIGWDSSGAFVWGSTEDDSRDLSFMLSLAQHELLKRVTE